MSKKAKRSVPSESEDSDFSSSEDSSSSNDDETVKVNGFQILVSEVSTTLFRSLSSNTTC